MAYLGDGWSGASYGGNKGTFKWKQIVTLPC